MHGPPISAQLITWSWRTPRTIGSLTHTSLFAYGITLLFHSSDKPVYLSALILAQQKSPFIAIDKVSSWICMWGSEPAGGSTGLPMGPHLSTSWVVKIQMGTVEELQSLMSTLPLFLSYVMLRYMKEWMSSNPPQKRKPPSGLANTFLLSPPLAVKSKFYTTNWNST